MAASCGRGRRGHRVGRVRAGPRPRPVRRPPALGRVDESPIRSAASLARPARPRPGCVSAAPCLRPVDELLGVGDGSSTVPASRSRSSTNCAARPRVVADRRRAMTPDERRAGRSGRRGRTASASRRRGTPGSNWPVAVARDVADRAGVRPTGPDRQVGVEEPAGLVAAVRRAEREAVGWDSVRSAGLAAGALDHLGPHLAGCRRARRSTYGWGSGSRGRSAGRAVAPRAGRPAPPSWTASMRTRAARRRPA